MKEKLERDEVVASLTVRLVHDVEIARIAQAAGFDTLYVDLEHGSLSFDEAGAICLAARAIGMAPFVRVPVSKPEHIVRALAGGALGVIAPHIGSAGEARAVITAARTMPSDAIMIIVQVESAQGLDRIEEIVAIDGVDLVLIGTNDLLAEQRMPGRYDHPLVRDAYARAIAACRANGKHVGVGGLSTRPDLVAQFVRMGARYVSTGTDHAFLSAACSERAKQVREIAL